LPDGLEGLRPYNLMTFKVAPRGAGRLGHQGTGRRGGRLPQARQPLAVGPASGGAVWPVRRGGPLPAQPGGTSTLAEGSGGRV
jgi:hypothetical protein